MRWWVTLVLVLLLAFASLWVANCSGPQPVVTAVEVAEPASLGQPYQVVAQVANRGPGHGEVHLLVRLRDRATGAVFQRQEQVVLEEDETARVIVPFTVPTGQYDADVQAEYPPR